MRNRLRGRQSRWVRFPHPPSFFDAASERYSVVNHLSTNCKAQLRASQRNRCNYRAKPFCNNREPVSQLHCIRREVYEVDLHWPSDSKKEGSNMTEKTVRGELRRACVGFVLAFAVLAVPPLLGWAAIGSTRPSGTPAFTKDGTRDTWRRITRWRGSNRDRRCRLTCGPSLASCFGIPMCRAGERTGASTRALDQLIFRCVAGVTHYKRRMRFKAPRHPLNETRRVEQGS